jgi:hypothetical protein
MENMYLAVALMVFAVLYSMLMNWLSGGNLLGDTLRAWIQMLKNLKNTA